MRCDAPCCCCCASPKGASFFCTSIHVFLGLYLSVKWVLVTFVNGLTNNNFDDSRMQLIYPLLLIYLCVFLVLGFVNFTAVEKESPSILKWSMRIFLLLQVSMLLTNTLLAFAFPESDNDLDLHRFHHLKFILINLILTSVYFFIIYRYIFSLENGIYVVHKKRRKKTPATSPPASAPWTSGSLGASHLHRPTVPPSNLKTSRLDEPDGQTLPLKSVNFADDYEPPSPSTSSSTSKDSQEPQPCSSKSSQ